MSAPTEFPLPVSLDAFRAIGKLMDHADHTSRSPLLPTHAEWAAARDLLVRYQQAEVEALRVAVPT